MLVTTKPPLQSPGLYWAFPLPDDSQRALHILPNMISWPVIFSWINPVTFLRKNVLSLALWEKYLINAVPKIFSLAEWAGRGSGLDKEEAMVRSWPTNPSPIWANVLLVTMAPAARIIYISLLQSFLQPLLLAGWVTSGMHPGGLPRKQAGFIQVSLPLNCCTDFGQITSLFYIFLSSSIKWGELYSLPRLFGFWGWKSRGFSPAVMVIGLHRFSSAPFPQSLLAIHQN